MTRAIFRAPVAATLATLLLASFAPKADARSHHSTPGGAPAGGINIRGVYSGDSLTQIDREVRYAHRLHAKLIRVEMPWSQFEPLGPGRFDPGTLAAADRVIEDAAAAHIKVIALIDNTPCWASSAPSSLLSSCVPDEHSKAKAWPPRKAGEYGAFVGWLTKRYGPHLEAIEVWNEPDQINQAYLTGPNKPQHYAALLRAAYPAIKHADHRVKVLAGSLVGSNGAFMKALYKAGVKGYYDGVAVHFYTLALGSLRAFRQVQIAHHDHKPLWLDEFGWSTCWPQQKIQLEQGCVTKKVQAANIINTFRELSRTKYVKAIVPYTLEDTSAEDFGVLTVNGTRKPAFNALSSVLRSPFGKPSPIELHLRRNHGSIVAVGSGPVGDYMKLEAFASGHLRYRATFTLNRFNRFSLKLPRALGTHGVRVRVYQYWMGRAKGVERGT